LVSCISLKMREGLTTAILAGPLWGDWAKAAPLKARQSPRAAARGMGRKIMKEFLSENQAFV
jgi:hypothetical protein